MLSLEYEVVAKGYAVIANALKANPEAVVIHERLKVQANLDYNFGNLQNALIASPKNS